MKKTISGVHNGTPAETAISAGVFLHYKDTINQPQRVKPPVGRMTTASPSVMALSHLSQTLVQALPEPDTFRKLRQNTTFPNLIEGGMELFGCMLRRR
jgi:hypothetical protein